jgi:hypothetical protein
LQGAALVVEDHDVDGAGENSAHGFELRWGWRLGHDIDGDDDVDIHLADDVGGKVIDDAAIDQHFAVEFLRSEHAGDGHGSAQSLRQ